MKKMFFVCLIVFVSCAKKETLPPAPLSPASNDAQLEYLKLGQRVKSFSVDAWKNGEWTAIANATTIGHKRILKIDPVETVKIRVNILESKACPVISNMELF